MTFAIVTGASRGIGRATALAFARRGLDVALLGRESQALEEAAEEVRSLDVRAIAVTCDVAIEGDVSEAALHVKNALGVPRIVVHNAGVVQRGARIEETTTESWDAVVGVNLRGPFLVTRAFLPAMREANEGRLVFVGSISSTIGCPGTASYAASKWGVVGLAKSLAEELRGTRLAALSVLPGSVDTDMLKGSSFPPLMTAEDVANTILYAALDAPLAMNGSAIEMFG